MKIIVEGARGESNGLVATEICAVLYAIGIEQLECYDSDKAIIEFPFTDRNRRALAKRKIA